MVTEFLISPSESSSDSSLSSSPFSSSPPARAPVCCGRADLGFLAFFSRLVCCNLDGSVIAPWMRCCEGKGGWWDLLGVEAVELGAWNCEIVPCNTHTPMQCTHVHTYTMYACNMQRSPQSNHWNHIRWRASRGRERCEIEIIIYSPSKVIISWDFSIVYRTHDCTFYTRINIVQVLC